MDILTMEEIHKYFAFIICEINFSFVGCKIWESLIYLFVLKWKTVCVFIDDRAESIKLKTENRDNNWWWEVAEEYFFSVGLIEELAFWSRDVFLKQRRWKRKLGHNKQFLVQRRKKKKRKFSQIATEFQKAG